MGHPPVHPVAQLGATLPSHRTLDATYSLTTRAYFTVVATGTIGSTRY